MSFVCTWFCKLSLPWSYCKSVFRSNFAALKVTLVGWLRSFLNPRKSMLPYKSVFESFCFENWLSYSTISLATLPRFETPVSSYFLVENRLRQSAQGSKRKNYFNLCCWSVHGKLSKWKELYPREKWLQPPNSLRNFLLPKNLKISFTFTTSCATC